MRGKSKVLSGRMVELEKAAGVNLWSADMQSGGRIDWVKYRAGQDTLASVNPEYKALRDELNALRNKKWEKQNARTEHKRELWASLLPVVDFPSLTDAQKIALRIARELLWQCKPATVERAEKTARKEAGAETPPSGKEPANAS